MAQVYRRHRFGGRQDCHVGPRFFPTPGCSSVAHLLHPLQLEGKRRRLLLLSRTVILTFRRSQNWLYRSDDFMMSQKLEQLLCIRNQLDQIEIISWNDVSS